MILYDFLRGQWFFHRKIHDVYASKKGILEGHIDFIESEDKGTLLYSEKGDMTYGNYQGQSQQAYIYNFPEDKMANVYFEDKRYFHDLDLRDKVWECAHLCGEDTYLGKFTLIEPFKLEIQWQVKGPRKEYTLISMLEKT